MNSFNTDDETKRLIQKYTGHKIQVCFAPCPVTHSLNLPHLIQLLTFNQSRYPRIQKESLTPCPRSPKGTNGDWYPPGHGDLFDSLKRSGLLDKLLEDGKEWLFVSNVDNLGATVDATIMQHVMANNAEFVMEVTDKTKADIKGGTLIDYEGRVRLLEVAQVSGEHVCNPIFIKRLGRLTSCSLTDG